MDLLTEIAMFLIFSIIGGIVALKLKQPPALGLIIAGSIVGPHALKIINSAELIDLSIEIGAILLLFAVGIHFSISNLIKSGLQAISIATMKLGTVFLAAYYISSLFGLDFLTSAYIGVIVSITSTVIFLKIIEQKYQATRSEIPLLVAVLIIEDIFGIFALTFFSNLNSSNDISPISIFTGLIISLAILATVYFVLAKIGKISIGWLLRIGGDEFLPILALGVCGLMVFLAVSLKLSPSVGAFLAGNIIAQLPNGKEFEKSINPFILTFTALFFLSIGTTVNYLSAANLIWLIAALIIANITFKMLSMGLGTYIIAKLGGKAATFSGIAMISVGEFSLLIAKEATAVTSIDLISITAIIIIASAFAMSLMLGREEQIYGSISRATPQPLIRSLRNISTFSNRLTASFINHKNYAKSIRIEWNKSVIYFGGCMATLSAAFIMYLYGPLDKSSEFFAPTASVFAAVFIVLFALAIRNSFKLIADIRQIFINIESKQAATETAILRNTGLIIALFLLMILVPNAYYLFRIDPKFNFLQIGMFTLIIILLIRTMNMVNKTIKKSDYL